MNCIMIQLKDKKGEGGLKIKKHLALVLAWIFLTGPGAVVCVWPSKSALVFPVTACLAEEQQKFM